MTVNPIEADVRSAGRRAAVLPGSDQRSWLTAPAPPGLGRSSSAAQVVLAYLREQAETLRTLEPSVRRDEPDAVHQMRVATRRLRGTLRSFGPVIPRSGTERLAGELKWLGHLLGAARDGEVLAAQLQASLRAVPAELLIGPVQARVQGHFAPRRAAARTELVAALDSRRYRRLLARRFARQMKKVQAVLGDHQDAVLARQAARVLGIGAHMAGENAFSYDLLRERESGRAERLQGQGRKVWQRASRSRYRRWMH